LLLEARSYEFTRGVSSRRGMPPPARSCVACKLSKTKCVNFAPGHRCDRCERVGLRCERAPSRTREASRAALGPALRNLLTDEDEAGSSGSSSRGVQPSGVRALSDATLANIPWLSSKQCISRQIFDNVRDFLLVPPGPGGFNVGLPIVILREWMAIARKRNAYALMQTTIGLSQLLGLGLDEIVMQETTPDFDAEGNIKTPALIAEIAQACDGYVFTRTSHFGYMGFSCSESFGRDICTLEQIYREWGENKRQVIAAFCHMEDIGELPRMLGRLWRSLRGNMQPAMGQTYKPVRIWRTPTATPDSTHGEWVSCTCNAALYVEGDGRKVSLTLMFKPVADALCTGSLAAVGGLAPRGGAEVAGPGREPARELSFGLPQSGLGTLPFRTAAPAAARQASAASSGGKLNCDEIAELLDTRKVTKPTEPAGESGGWPAVGSNYNSWAAFPVPGAQAGAASSSAGWSPASEEESHQSAAVLLSELADILGVLQGEELQGLTQRDFAPVVQGNQAAV